jgi:D-proline reductase (dithiol) PrdB
MCNQSVGLIQSVIEKRGIPTTSVTLLREVTEKVLPPRSLFVDLPLGYPLGQPNDAEMQREILVATLRLLELDKPLPILEEYRMSESSLA